MPIAGVTDKLIAGQPTTNGKAAQCCTGSRIYKELTLHEQHARTSNSVTTFHIRQVGLLIVKRIWKTCECYSWSRN